MAKYSYEFKKVVDAYLKGEGSHKYLLITYIL